MESLAQFIENLPTEKFDMSDWLEIDWDSVDFDYHSAKEKLFCKTDVENICGTACCIAGWQAIKNNKCLDIYGGVHHKNGKRIATAWTYAEEYLDLDSSQSDDLFFTGGWPEKFASEKATPKVAAARIRHMIETGK